MKVYEKVWRPIIRVEAWCMSCGKWFSVEGKSRRAAEKRLMENGMKNVKTRDDIGNMCKDCRLEFLTQGKNGALK